MKRFVLLLLTVHCGGAPFTQGAPDAYDAAEGGTSTESSAEGGRESSLDAGAPSSDAGAPSSDAGAPSPDAGALPDASPETAPAECTHDNGTGQTFSDHECSMSERLALDACAAFAGKVSLCIVVADACQGTDLVCDVFGNDCVCWAYAGPAAGHVHDPHNGADAGACACVAKVDPTWF